MLYDFSITNEVIHKHTFHIVKQKEKNHHIEEMEQDTEMMYPLEVEQLQTNLQT